jgi:hypothetical protein
VSQFLGTKIEVIDGALWVDDEFTLGNSGHAQRRRVRELFPNILLLTHRYRLCRWII